MKWSVLFSGKGRINLTLIFSLIIIISFITGIGWAEERTVGLISRDINASEGYTLFRPIGAEAGGSIYLINNAGNPVHEWEKPLPTRPGGEVFIRDNGELVLTTNTGAYAIDWDGEIVWEINNEGEWLGHHECVEIELPNGNFLVPGFTAIPRAEAEAAGFDVSGANACDGRPDLDVLLVDSLWEIKLNNPDCGEDCLKDRDWEVVWRWNVWDHITEDVNDPKKIHIGYDDPAGGICSHFLQGGWTFGRFNALSYNADRQEIIVSASLFNEIWVIDHNTTTAQAAGPAGDLLYRWGNPCASGTGDCPSYMNNGSQQLFGPHASHLIKPGYPGEGNVLIWDNGWMRPASISIPGGFAGILSRTLEVNLGDGREPYTTSSDDNVWQFLPNSSMYNAFVGDARRLPNGNTLVSSSIQGHFIEATPEKDIVWEFIVPPLVDGVRLCIAKDEDFIANFTGVVRRYDKKFAGFKCRKKEFRKKTAFNPECPRRPYKFFDKKSGP